MAEFASMPLFTDAWIADTTHLDRAERGLYMDLIILMWRSPSCRVPNEIDWIARKIRASDDEVKTLEGIIEEFCSKDGNWLFQKRLQKEWNYTFSKRRKNSDSAKSRWSKENYASERNAGDGCERNAPSPSPSPSKERETNVSPKNAKGSRIPADWQLPNDWSQWAVEQGLDGATIRLEADRFKDYWLSVAGQKGVKLDWSATWRNWMRKRIEERAPSKVPGRGQQGNLDWFNGFQDIGDFEYVSDPATGMTRKVPKVRQ